MSFESLEERKLLSVFTFTRIADTDTPIPSGSGNFTTLRDPALDDGNVVFLGNGADEQRGVYAFFNGSLQRISDQSTAVPGGTGSFSWFASRPSIDGSNVAFAAYGGSDGMQRGVYAVLNGSLQVVADLSSPVPSSTSSFGDFITGQSLEGAHVVFQADTYDGSWHAGIYEWINGSLQMVVDTNTPQPGTTGSFGFLGAPSLENGDVAFWSQSFSQGQWVDGIYARMGGTVQVIADHSTAVPGESGNFTTFATPSLDSGDVAFWGVGSVFGGGVYASLNGTIQVIADQNTPIPSGQGNFTSFSDARPSLQNGKVAFRAWGFAGGTPYGQQGIFIYDAGTLSKVIARGDTIDGKMADYFETTIESLSGDSVVFDVTFVDGSRGIYRADPAAPADTAGPHVVSTNPVDAVGAPFDHIDIEFSEAIIPETLPGNVALFGPDGRSIDVGLSQQTESKFIIGFVSQSQRGVYSLVVSPNVSDLAGNAMDQDLDGTSGEVGEDEFATTIEIARMFVFTFNGFCPSSCSFSEEQTGMELLHERITTGLSTLIVSPPPFRWSTGRNAAGQLRKVGKEISSFLVSHEAVPGETIVLIGHSYGGELAYQLASNKKGLDGKGRIFATGLITFDPINAAHTKHRHFDQSVPARKPHNKAVPSFVVGHALNFVQRTPDPPPDVLPNLRGYYIDGVTEVVANTFHREIDDDLSSDGTPLGLHDRVIQFLHDLATA